MGCAAEGMMLVRADLCERLERLRAPARRGSAREVAMGVDAIRLIAAAYGLVPVVRLAEALERAIAATDAYGEPACPADLYLDRLGDAIGCARMDEQASQALLASISVRLA